MDTMKTERVPVMLDPNFLKEVDDFRFGRRISSRSAAVRTLIQKGLEAAKHETAA